MCAMKKRKEADDINEYAPQDSNLFLKRAYIEKYFQTKGFMLGPSGNCQRIKAQN